MMKNDLQRCKIKVRKFLSNISWCFGVMEENLWRGADSANPPAWIRLRLQMSAKEMFNQFFSTYKGSVKPGMNRFLLDLKNLSYMIFEC